MINKPFHILVTGASGLVGSALTAFLEEKGHVVLPYTRQISMDLEGFDVVVHLAGESISSGFWTKTKKKKIWESRVEGTKKLVSALNVLKKPPKLFISASAVGYYASSDAAQNEESPPGSGFLSSLCLEWEKASSCFIGRSIQVRFGYILSSKGGILKALLPLFRLGLGGKMGSGKQFFPWVALEDVVRALYYIMEEETIKTPVNIVSPSPMPQEEFAKLLAKALRRPSFFSIPKWLLLGEKARELILPSLCILPCRLEKSGFIFSYKMLSEFFQEKLQKKNDS